MELKEMLQLAGIVATVGIPLFGMVGGVLLWFIRREISRLDALPEAMQKLSYAIARLTRWKFNTQEDMQGMLTRISRLEKKLARLRKAVMTHACKSHPTESHIGE